mgnify:CR=1 FL=1
MKNKEIEVLVKSYIEDDPDYYVVRYRPKHKTFLGRMLIHESWRDIYKVLNHGRLYASKVDMPTLFSDYDEALEYAKKIKANPELIEQHNQEQQEICKQRNTEREKRIAEARRCTII